MSEKDALRQQIYERMQMKDTAELLRIWEENDRSAWTDEAFLAIKQILVERIGEAPPQSPYYDLETANTDQGTEDDEDSDEIAQRLRWLAFSARLLS